MTHTLAQFRESLGAMLSGLDLDDVTDLNGSIERGMRNVISRAKIPEAMGRQSITLYDHVYDYTSPTGIFGSSLIDLRPQGDTRTPLDYNRKTYIANFDRTKAWLSNGYQLAFEYASGQQIMRVAQVKATARILLDAMNSTTGWTASGNASGLTVDRTVIYEDYASLRFNLAAAGSQGILTKAITSVDLTSYQGVGKVFLALQIPSTNLTSVRLRLGSDASNYYEVTSTAGFIGAFKASTYFLVPFDLASASQTGTPVITAMDYVQLAFNYNGTAMPNVYVGSLFICLPSPHEILYQTSSVFQNTAGTISASITDNNDTILLNDSTYNIALKECAFEIEIQQSGGRATALSQQFSKDLYDPINGLYTLYRQDNPSQEMKTVGNYMDD